MISQNHLLEMCSSPCYGQIFMDQLHWTLTITFLDNYLYFRNNKSLIFDRLPKETNAPFISLR